MKSIIMIELPDNININNIISNITTALYCSNVRKLSVSKKILSNEMNAVFIDCDKVWLLDDNERKDEEE